MAPSERGLEGSDHPEKPRKKTNKRTQNVATTNQQMHEATMTKEEEIKKELTSKALIPD